MIGWLGSWAMAPRMRRESTAVEEAEKRDNMELKNTMMAVVFDSSGRYVWCLIKIVVANSWICLTAATALGGSRMEVHSQRRFLRARTSTIVCPFWRCAGGGRGADPFLPFESTGHSAKNGCEKIGKEQWEFALGLASVPPPPSHTQADLNNWWHKAAGAIESIIRIGRHLRHGPDTRLILRTIIPH